VIADNTSPLFWRCNCPDNVIHFSDDDVCERCGVREAESPDANVSLIQRFLPFIPVETVPQQILQGIVFAGDATIHTGSDAHSRVEDAFFTLRERLRNHFAGDTL
jgi:hypothetical protein